MKTQHTPGPWQFNDLDASIWPGPTGSRRAPVATVFTAAQPESELSQESDHFTPEEAANARLIAAAPVLLEVLRYALAYASHPIHGNNAHAASVCLYARAAIAKATGETHSNPVKVTVEVTGGVAEVTSCPAGVQVEIIDHDNEKYGG